MIKNSARSEGWYVQGAADDSESWARGITPTLFWRHKVKLLATLPNETEDLIKELLYTNLTSNGQLVPAPNPDLLVTLIKPTTCVFLGSSGILEHMVPTKYDAVIVCSAEPDGVLEAKWKKKYVHLACPVGKLGGRLLRRELPKMQQTLTRFQPFRRLLFCCATGKDVSIGAALVALCLYFNKDGVLSNLCKKNGY